MEPTSMIEARNDKTGDTCQKDFVMASNSAEGANPYDALVNEGLELARAEIALKGAEVKTWAFQYADACRKSVTARIRGDGTVFRQALVFPLVSAPSAGLVLPLAGHALYVVAELPDGMLIHFRLWERSPTGLRLGEFLARIAHCFDKSARATTQLAELERCSKTALARRIVYRDFPLDGAAAGMLFVQIPNLAAHLADMVFAGFSELPYTGKLAVRDALARRMTKQFTVAYATFVGTLDGNILQAIGGSDEPPSVLAYNLSLLESRRPRRHIEPVDE